MKLKIKTDFQKLADAFAKAPEETRQMVQKQMKIAVESIKDRASREHRYKSRSGVLERDGIVTRVVENKGIVMLNSRVPYGVYVHQGTKPHIIQPSKKQVLRWSDGVRFFFARKVNHPGTQADPFLYNSAEKELPLIQSRFENALEKLVRDL